MWFRKNVSWILVLALSLVVLSMYLGNSRLGTDLSLGQPQTLMTEAGVAMMDKVGLVPSFREAVPVVQEDRLVIRDTSLSLLVDGVTETIKKIEGLATQRGGYLVESRLEKPEEGETGVITIRIPTDKRGEIVEEIKGLGVRVISENVIGEDVTDEYVDLEARLITLLSTKQKLEDLLSQATEVSQILEVQRELTNLQYQIDQLKGQQKFLEQSAKLSRIAVYLATDELALPYAPSDSWRPGVIFKQAVRSLVRSVRDLGNLLIWVIVYLPVWLPIVGIAWWIGMKKKRNG